MTVRELSRTDVLDIQFTMGREGMIYLTDRKDPAIFIAAPTRELAIEWLGLLQNGERVPNHAVIQAVIRENHLYLVVPTKRGMTYKQYLETVLLYQKHVMMLIGSSAKA